VAVEARSCNSRYMLKLVCASLVAALLVSSSAFADDPPIALAGMHAFGYKNHAHGMGGCKKISVKQAADMKTWKCHWVDTASNGRAVSCDSPDGKRGLTALATHAACSDERETEEANAE
jgi:hypothetical protein